MSTFCAIFDSNAAVTMRAASAAVTPPARLPTSRRSTSGMPKVIPPPLSSALVIVTLAPRSVTRPMM